MRYLLPMVALFVVAICSSASAWSEAGHKIVASIAFRQLSADQRQRVVNTIKKHPRWTSDFESKLPASITDNDDKCEWFFQQAAIWPDMARNFSGSARATFHRPEWHYINVPHFLSVSDRANLDPTVIANLELNPPDEPKERMNVVQTIRIARRQVDASSGVSAKERAVMLGWLFHTTGDLHQPMHSTALFSTNLFPHGDRGGNLVQISQRGNLHSLWDKFPGDNVQFTTAKNRALEMLADQTLSQLGEAAAANLNESDWLNESHNLAVSVAYDPEIIVYLRGLEREGASGDLPPVTLTEDYLSHAGIEARKRIVQAGFRLGAVLNDLFPE